MAIKLTKVPFAGTAEQEAQLRAVLAETKKMRGGLMPSLQKAQGIYGYLPIEVQKIIADELNVALEEVFGVATFYAQFTLNPQGKFVVAVCMGTACYVKKADEILDRLAELLKIKPGDCTEDGEFSLLGTRCIGCCGLAPVLTVNEHVFGKVGKGDMEKVLEPFQKGEIAK